MKKPDTRTPDVKAVSIAYVPPSQMYATAEPSGAPAETFVLADDAGGPPPHLASDASLRRGECRLRVRKPGSAA